MSRRFETDDATLVREPGVDALAGVMPKLDDEPGPAWRLSTARTRGWSPTSRRRRAAARVGCVVRGAETPEASEAPAPSTTTASAPAPRKRWVPLLAAALVPPRWSAPAPR
jgi:hypothetical protein